MEEIKMTRAVVLAAFILGAACLIAHGETGDATVDTAARKLTGGRSRDWVFVQMIKMMGESEKCSQGEVYRFSADGTLVIEKCVGEKVVRASHHWAVTQAGQLDTVLTIDGESYELLFKDDGNAHLMRLRVRSGSKTVPTTDREFRLSED